MSFRFGAAVAQRGGRGKLTGGQLADDLFFRFGGNGARNVTVVPWVNSAMQNLSQHTEERFDLIRGSMRVESSTGGGTRLMGNAPRDPVRLIGEINE